MPGDDPLAPHRIEQLKEYSERQHAWSWPEGHFAQTTLALIADHEETKARVLALDAALTKLTSDRDADLKRAGEDVKRFRVLLTECIGALRAVRVDDARFDNLVPRSFRAIHGLPEPTPEPDGAA